MQFWKNFKEVDKMAVENDKKIIAFMCWKWGYGAGDMAGTIRAQYPATIRPIRINCTGRVTPSLMMRAMGKGADGVIVAGWYEGECDYETGNLVAAKNVEYTREILKAAGMDPDRIQMFHCSAAEGQRFQQEVTRVSEIIENIGKNPIKKSVSKNESKEK
jgi:F420-non-reducing hydrogenase iron-sulfur subunit